MSYEQVKEIVKDAGLGYLATVEGSEPRVRPVMPAIFHDGVILAATSKDSPKILQVQKNNNFEICFVDKKLSQVRFRGKITITSDMKKKAWLANAVPMLRAYFPTDDDPNFVVMELKPEKILLINVGEAEYTEVTA